MIHRQKLLYRLNLKRINKNQRILWPDYQIQYLTSQGVLLNNLYLYIQFQKFQVIQSSPLNSIFKLQQFNQDFTHVAFIFSQRQLNSQPSVNDNKKINSFSENDIQSEFQYFTKTKNQTFITLILTKRAFAVDQILRTSYKLSICVIPLCDTKHLWGGVLTFDNFKVQDKKQQTCQAQRRGSQSYKKKFQQNRMSQFKNPNKKIYNPSNIKRQKMFSNFTVRQQSNVKQTLTSNINHAKCLKNIIKINPLNVISKKQLLYIQIPLIDNPQIPNYEQKCIHFQDIIFYGSWRQPIYGKRYENNEMENDKQDQYQYAYQNEEKNQVFNIGLSNDVFNMYSMPFRQFNSFLDSMINPDQELPNLKFDTNQKFFSALKRLSLTSQIKQKQESKNYQKLKSLSKIQSDSLKSQVRQNIKNPSFQSPQCNSLNRKNNVQLSLYKYEKTRKKIHQSEIKQKSFQVQIQSIIWSEKQNIFKTNEKQQVFHSSMYFQQLKNQKVDNFISKIHLKNLQINTKQKQSGSNSKYQRLSLERELDLSQSQNNTNTQNIKKQCQKSTFQDDYNDFLRTQTQLMDNKKKSYAYFSVIRKCSFKPTYVPFQIQKLERFTNCSYKSILQKTIQIESNYNNNNKEEQIELFTTKNQKIRVFILQQNYPIQTINTLQKLINIKSKQTLKEFIFNIIQNSLDQFNILKLLLKLFEELRLIILLELFFSELIHMMACNNQLVFTLIKKYCSQQKVQGKQKILYEFQKTNEKEYFFIQFWIYLYQNLNDQAFKTQSQNYYTINVKKNIQNVLNDFFLVHAKTIVKKFYLEFNYKIQKICKKNNGIQSVLTTIQHFLHFYQDIPYQFIANSLQISHKKSQNLYLDTISELLSLIVQLKDCKNIIELLLFMKKNEQTKSTQVIVKRKELKLENFQNCAHIIPINIFNIKKISNKQDQTNPKSEINHIKEVFDDNQNNDFQKDKFNKYKVSYNIYSKNICKSIQEISIISQKIKIKTVYNDQLYPFSSKIENFNFVITFTKRKNQNQMFLSFVIQSEHSKNYFKEPSFDFRTFKSYETIVKIVLNQKYFLFGKNICTFLVDTPTQHFIKLNSEQQSQIQLEFQHLKRVQVSILMKKKSIYDCSLMFLNMRLPSYINKIIQSQSKSQFPNNNRKTMGKRMTQNLNRRQSFLSIQNEMFLTQQQIQQLQKIQENHLHQTNYSIYSLPEEDLFQILSTDRNYIQKQQKLFKFVVSYYKKNTQLIFSEKNRLDRLLMTIRYKFVPLSTLLKYSLDSVLKNNLLYQQIVSSILSQNVKNSNNQQIGQYLINRPRVTTQKLLKTKQQRQQQNKLILEYMKQKQTKDAQKTSQMFYEQKELEI